MNKWCVCINIINVCNEIWSSNVIVMNIINDSNMIMKKLLLIIMIMIMIVKWNE